MRALRLVVACVLPAVARAASAVAVLLTTKPSGKSDGWNPRSVKAADSSNACAAGVSLCAVLVLRDTVRRFGNVPDADFVAMVDAPYTFFEPPPGEDEIVYGARKNSKQQGSVCYGSSIVLLLTLALMTVLSACFFVLDRSSLLHVWEKSRGEGSASGHSRLGNLTDAAGNFSAAVVAPKL